ncbi:hypothetical protein AAHB94_13165 [Bacillus toyonensis]
MITDEKEFFDRLDNALKEKNIHACHGRVKYFDEHVESPLKEEDYRKDITQAFFYKKTFLNHKRNIAL